MPKTDRLILRDLAPEPAKPRPTLYEITVEHREIADILYENDGEFTEDQAVRLDAVLRVGREKLDAAAAVWRRLKREAEMCEEEEARLKVRREAFWKDANNLRSRMLVVVDELYSGKIKTVQNTIYAQTSAAGHTFEVAADADMTAMDPSVLRVSYELNKLELQRKVKAGEPIPPEIKVEDRPGTRFLNIR